ncbi:MAG: 8-oxo-dGTP pyrophosphatase MutT (NUDIX family) [Glaciecola sp.]
MSFEVPDPEPATLREAVRAVLIHDDAILLARAFDRHDAARTWWELPGGGIEVGESVHEALRRELREETGYVDVAIGRELCEWTTQWVFSDREIEQHDRVHVVTLATAERVAPTPLATEGLAGVVWVPLALIDDLRAPVVPVTLAALTQAATTDGPSIEIAMPPRVPWPMVNGAQVFVRLWAKAGRELDLRLTQDALLALALDHGGVVSARSRPLALGPPEEPSENVAKLPDEVHLLRFDGPLELDAYLADPRRAAIDTGAIARSEIMPVGSVPTSF